MSRHTRTRVIGLVLTASVLAVPLRAEVPCDEDPACDGSSAWATFTHVELRQSAAGVPGFVEWDARFDHAAFDASIDGTIQAPDESFQGTVALVGGRFMLNRGLEVEPGYEIDVLDVPLLTLTLLTKILGRLFPGGPEELSGSTAVDRLESVGIEYATPSASGHLPAPWRVRGRAERLASGDVTFELDVSFPLEQAGQASSGHTMRMSGRLGTQDGPLFVDDDSLDGWQTYRLGPRRIEQEGSTIYDYGAWPDETASYETIADLRAFIAAESHPGHPDESRNFTGFWKRDCGDDFGLRIAPHGDDGRYTVVFCGPGGCGQSDQPTFITGDPAYEVVGESELIQVSQWGERTRYIRCPRETP